MASQEYIARLLGDLLAKTSMKWTGDSFVIVVSGSQIG